MKKVSYGIDLGASSEAKLSGMLNMDLEWDVKGTAPSKYGVVIIRVNNVWHGLVNGFAVKVDDSVHDDLMYYLGEYDGVSLVREAKFPPSESDYRFARAQRDTWVSLGCHFLEDCILSLEDNRKTFVLRKEVK